MFGFFPESITYENSIVCYPLPVGKSKYLGSRSDRKIKNKSIKVGWLGRISEEKNFDVALKILRILYSTVPCKLYLCGPVQPEYRTKFQELLERTPRDIRKNIIHVGNGKLVDRNGTQNFLRTIDLLLFPSVASMESLGRIIVEASQFRIPVIAANYAAAPELIPKEYLAEVRYKQGTYDFYKIHSIGTPDINKMVELCVNLKGKKGLFVFDKYAYGYEKLIDVITSDVSHNNHQISPNAKHMINSIDIFIPNFNLRKECAIEKATKYFYKRQIDDIAITSKAIAEYLNFHPYFKMKDNTHAI